MVDERDVQEVRPPTVADVRRICAALAEEGARYVLIGALRRSLRRISSAPRSCVWRTR
jgi:hypothetical protein